MRKAHHGGTGTWLIEGDGFTEWKNNGTLLWIHGKPGSGKSVLCSTIIQEFIRMREAGLASIGYFYFDRENTEMQDARGLVSSLLIQLSEQSELCSEIISRLYSAHATGSEQAGDDALLECLKDMLSIPGQGPIYLILDGLDQSPDDPSARESVLDLIQLLVQLGHPHLHICVSSRIEADIRAVLRPLASQTICLDEQSGQAEDINNYINSFIKTNANTSQWKDEDKEFVIKKVSEEADGMFRWAHCRLNQLRRCLPEGIQQTLGEFPKTMEEEYERILLDIDANKWKCASRLFRCIAVAARPLHVSELAEFLALDFKPTEFPTLEAGWRPKDPEYAVLATCSSFIHIVNVNGSLVVQFSHLSMKQFLTSNGLTAQGGPVSRYHFPIEAAHDTVAQGCLAALLHLDEHVNRSSIANFPLASYAAQHFPIHAPSQYAQSYIRNALKHLFDANKPHFAIWVWIYDVDDTSEQLMTSETPSQPKATPLYYASLLGFHDIVQWLLSRKSSGLNDSVGYYGTPLIAASAKGHYEIASLLIIYRANVNVNGPDGRTALYSAIEVGQQGLVQLLLEYGANTSYQDNSGRTALDIARDRGRKEIVQLLLDHHNQMLSF
ncbi:hypothetical protein B0F90DRAFT_1822883 [Multifurca ochricompacta]|uniref:NACHT domain-containing protein n=1 Tax=Multifurca ochricompacta TaxID=376703 RepID=A0AAD4QIF4_9AGAM|nr:hypothetical protein B0F90DRAFT_1822883 [Multifurca ochricompacta]